MFADHLGKNLGTTVGVDWKDVGKIDEIDFVSIHMWTDQWQTNDPEQILR